MGCLGVETSGWWAQALLTPEPLLYFVSPPARPSMPPASIWVSTSSLTPNAWLSTAQGGRGSEVPILPQFLSSAPSPFPPQSPLPSEL